MLLRDILEGKKESRDIAAEYCGTYITYHTLFCSAERTAELFGKMKIRRKPVGIFLPNSIDYIEAFFSAVFSENIIAPVSVTSKDTDIISTLEYCRLSVFITTERYGEILKKTLSNCPYRASIFLMDTSRVEEVGGTRAALDNNDFDTGMPAGENDVTMLLHTSGTTSNPKRVMLTHRNLISNAISVSKVLKLDKSSKTLLTLPLYLASGNLQMLTHLYSGAPIIIMDGPFLASAVLARIQKEKVTNFFGVPFMLKALTDFGKAYKYNTASLRFMCFGGGPLPEQQIKSFLDMFPQVGFSEMYGQTEASPRISHLLPEDSRRKIGSAGRPIPGVKVKIIDENGDEAGPGMAGELIARGDNIMKGYYRNSSETDKAIRNGWLHTGDLARMDEDGYIYITGRVKNIIIYCGFNIYPEEIEEVLLSYPGVAEAFVYAAEDELSGQVPVAKVVPERSARLTSEMLIEYCLDRLEGFKVPNLILLVDYIDKTMTGKVKRSTN